MTTKKPRNRPELSARELQMAATMKRNAGLLGETQAALADRIGVTQGMLGHWLNGRERVSVEKAEALAQLLSLSPHEVSLAYKTTNKPIDDLRDDIYALRFAILGLATVLSEKRPVEGAAFDARIRKVAAKFPHFLEGDGWLGLLLGEMRKARDNSEASSPLAPARKASSSGQRKR